MKINLVRGASVSLVVIAASLGGFSTVAHAQNAAPQAEADYGQKIIVTAQKRSERLQDVSRTVNVVQGETLQKLNLKTFSDIQQLSPGLSLNSKEPSNNSVTLRGVGFDPNSASSPTVDIYFNETPLDTNSAFRGLYDVVYYEDSKSQTSLTQTQVLPFGLVAGATPPLDIAVLNVGVEAPSRVKTYAVFTDHRFQLTDKLQFQAGLRYQETDVKRDFVQTLTAPLFPVPDITSGISPENRNATYRQLTGGASVKYDFNRDLTACASYGRSYRPEGVVATAARLDEDVLVFDAEKSNSYEPGVKGAFADRRVTFAVAVYQQDFANYLAYTGSYLAVSTAKDGVFPWSGQQL